MTCRYFDRFLLQVDKNWRQACFCYLAPGLMCEGYWQAVNSRRSIFRFADPINGDFDDQFVVTDNDGASKLICHHTLGFLSASLVIIILVQSFLS